MDRQISVKNVLQPDVAHFLDASAFRSGLFEENMFWSKWIMNPTFFLSSPDSSYFTVANGS